MRTQPFDQKTFLKIAITQHWQEGLITKMSANNQMACDFCSVPYDPVATRWLCPNCHMKTNCCDGAPCEIVEVKTTTSN